ncbi:MAG: hypothetical protein KAQ83_01920, partial [Nanoarchaeota archaeon]|nr:hypothetical protein [Nanoarchaeota archaeon]
MRTIHQRLINSKFKEKYLGIKTQLPRVKHLIHGGIENYYAGLERAHLLSLGVQERLCDESIERTISNIELGLEYVNGTDLVWKEVYISCSPRQTQSERVREAIWQYSIFVDYTVAAVIGINLHKEKEKTILTFANIQGHNSKGVIKLKDSCG